MTAAALTRHPRVEHRRVALSEERHELQIQRGLYTVDRGERFAFPLDRLDEPTVYLNRELWRFDRRHGVHRPGVKFRSWRSERQRRVLGWLRDHVHREIPSLYYRALLGHDLHVSTVAELHGEHWHRGWASPFFDELLRAGLNPFDPAPDPTFETAPWHPGHVARVTLPCERHAARWSRDCRACGRLSEPIADWRARAARLNAGKYLGFSEALGLLSGAKVTDAFVSEEIDELVSATGTEYADFDFHEVGTSAQAEDNNDTALITTSGIARATGTPADEDPAYANDATITADATESWEEHGLFNNATSVALLDRSLTGGQAVNSSDQVTYAYTLTKNPEA